MIGSGRLGVEVPNRDRESREDRSQLVDLPAEGLVAGVVDGGGLVEGGVELLGDRHDDTVPGYVHGIVSIEPPTIRCDGCGLEATGSKLGLLVLTCGIRFNAAGTTGDRRRLCVVCRKAAGWDE